MNETTPAVLIVDDEKANAHLFKAILKGVGADLYCAASGAEALALCQQHEFALILLDARLPDMSGFDVALKLRESVPPVLTPIVFVSAVYTHEADAFHAYNLGAVDYLLSPVVPAILRAKAAVFIRLYRMHHEALAQRVAIEAAYRELRAAHSELEHFSYSASHDLRTPLHQIAGFAALVSMNGGAALDGKCKMFVGRIVEATKRMNTLIDDLLTLSRITGGDLQPAPVDLSALAREIVRELGETQPARQVLWKVADDLRVRGNAGLLRVALTNLLGNAWKYSAGSAPAEIELGVLVGETRTYFVGDNGAGFDAKAAGDRLFRPFQRFHANTDFEGTGVGLSIVQRIMIKHGGSIRAESAPGRGARFLFTLPDPGVPAVTETRTVA